MYEGENQIDSPRKKTTFKKPNHVMVNTKNVDTSFFLRPVFVSKNVLEYILKNGSNILFVKNLTFLQ